jgi:hypothetical protein
VLIHQDDFGLESDGGKTIGDGSPMHITMVNINSKDFELVEENKGLLDLLMNLTMIFYKQHGKFEVVNLEDSHDDKLKWDVFDTKF